MLVRTILLSFLALKSLGWTCTRLRPCGPAHCLFAGPNPRRSDCRVLVDELSMAGRHTMASDGTGLTLTSHVSPPVPLSCSSANAFRRATSSLHAPCVSPAPLPPTPSFIHPVPSGAWASCDACCCGEESPFGPQSAVPRASSGDANVAWTDAVIQECESRAISTRVAVISTRHHSVRQSSQLQAGSDARTRAHT